MSKNFNPEIGRGTQWKKGQRSPNPGGRPRNKLLTEAYREQLAERYPGDRKRRTFAQVIAAKVAAEAANGSLRAAAELADRTEGRAQQASELEQSDAAMVSLQEEWNGLTNEELYERVIEITLEMDRAIAIAGIEDRVALARAERAKEEVGVYRNYKQLEISKLHSE
jgi:Family of unknown function (DUF5681)